jgi:putative transposase
MQSLGRRYVQYANRHYRRTGSLWEGRYKSSVVQEESYLLACMRYIELNPVRAAMVADPGGYRWSSYRANGLAQPDARLTPHPLYLGLDVEPASRCNAYRALFRPQLDADAASEVREALRWACPWAASTLPKPSAPGWESGAIPESGADTGQRTSANHQWF